MGSNKRLKTIKNGLGGKGYKKNADCGTAREKMLLSTRASRGKDRRRLSFTGPNTAISSIMPQKTQHKWEQLVS